MANYKDLYGTYRGLKLQLTATEAYIPVQMLSFTVMEALSRISAGLQVLVFPAINRLPRTVTLGMMLNEFPINCDGL